MEGILGNSICPRLGLVNDDECDGDAKASAVEADDMINASADMADADEAEGRLGRVFLCGTVYDKRR